MDRLNRYGLKAVYFSHCKEISFIAHWNLVLERWIWTDPENKEIDTMGDSPPDEVLHDMLKDLDEEEAMSHRDTITVTFMHQ